MKPLADGLATPSTLVPPFGQIAIHYLRTNHEQMGLCVLHRCCMEQTARCVTPCNYMEPAEHTESVMQREFSTRNKLRADKKSLILLR
jgi:hypothetical protein